MAEIDADAAVTVMTGRCGPGEAGFGDYVDGVRAVYRRAVAGSAAPAQFRHQDGVAAVLAEGTPYRGLLVMHGLGTGKSLTSVRVCQANPSRRVWVVTKAALSGHASLAEAVRASRKGPPAGTDPEFDAAFERDEYANIAGYARELIKTTGGGAWVGLPALEAMTPRERVAHIDAHYTFVHYNGGESMLRRVLRTGNEAQYDKGVDTTHMLRRALNRVDGQANPFDGCVVVVDEAHNVSEGVINSIASFETGGGGFKQGAPSNFPALYALLTRARGCKAVLLTATPIKNRTASYAILVNMAAGHRAAQSVRRDKGAGRRGAAASVGEELRRHLAAAWADAHPGGPPLRTAGTTVALADDYATGARCLVYRAPAGVLFEGLGTPGRFVSAAADAQAGRERQDVGDDVLRAACSLAGLRLDRQPVLLPTPFPPPIAVDRDGSLQYLPGGISAYMQTFDPIGKSDPEPATLRSVGAAAGLVSITSGDAARMPVLVYHCTGDRTQDVEPCPRMVRMGNQQSAEYAHAHKRSSGRVDDSNPYQNVVETTQRGLMRAGTDQDFPPEGAAEAPGGLLGALERYSTKYHVLMEGLLGGGGVAGAGGATRKTLVYSRLMKSGGVASIARVLEQFGFTEWLPGDNGGGASRKYARYTGEVAQSDRGKVLEAYGRYDRVAGRTGHGFAVLLMTEAGAEGLNTKGVEQVFVMEPFWHNVRLDQVVGRARRADSHTHWDELEPPVRKAVDVHVLVALRAEGAGTTTSDYKMWTRAVEKKENSDLILGSVLEPASIEAPDTAAVVRADQQATAAAWASGRTLADLLLADAAQAAAMRGRGDYDALLHQARAIRDTQRLAPLLRAVDRRAFVCDARTLLGDLYNRGTPWALPVVRTAARIGSDTRPDPFPVKQGDFGRFRDAFRPRAKRGVFAFEEAPEELARLTDSRWGVLPGNAGGPQVGGGKSWFDYMRNLYGPEMWERNWRIFPDAPAGGAARAMRRAARMALLPPIAPEDGEEEEDAADGGEAPQLALDQMGKPRDRYMTWAVRGELRGGPRQFSSNPENLIRNNKQTRICERCGDTETFVPCQGRNFYEPARKCGDKFADKAEHLLVAALAQTAVTNPSTMEGVAPYAAAERFRVVGTLVLPTDGRTAPAVRVLRSSVHHTVWHDTAGAFANARLGAARLFPCAVSGGRSWVTSPCLVRAGPSAPCGHGTLCAKELSLGGAASVATGGAVLEGAGPAAVRGYLRSSALAKVVRETARERLYGGGLRPAAVAEALLGPLRCRGVGSLARANPVRRAVDRLESRWQQLLAYGWSSHLRSKRAKAARDQSERRRKAGAATVAAPPKHVAEGTAFHRFARLTPAQLRGFSVRDEEFDVSSLRVGGATDAALARARGAGGEAPEHARAGFLDAVKKQFVGARSHKFLVRARRRIEEFGTRGDGYTTADMFFDLYTFACACDVGGAPDHDALLARAKAVAERAALAEQYPGVAGEAGKTTESELQAAWDRADEVKDQHQKQEHGPRVRFLKAVCAVAGAGDGGRDDAAAAADAAADQRGRKPVHPTVHSRQQVVAPFEAESWYDPLVIKAGEPSSPSAAPAAPAGGTLVPFTVPDADTAAAVAAPAASHALAGLSLASFNGTVSSLNRNYRLWRRSQYEEDAAAAASASAAAVEDLDRPPAPAAGAGEDDDADDGYAANEDEHLEVDDEGGS